MSEIKKTTKRIVNIKENDLIDVIDGIVTEAVAAFKTQWLSEQAKTKKTMLENKVLELERKINQITEGKK